MTRATIFKVAAASILAFAAAPALAAIPDSGLLNDVTNQFLTRSATWGTRIKFYATWIFWLLALLSMVWTFGMMALRKADIGEVFAEFIKFTVTTGFFWWLLDNGPRFALDIINSMRRIGADAGGLPGTTISPSTPLSIAFDIVKKAFNGLSWVHPVDNLAIVLVSAAIVVAMAVVAANVLIALVQAYVVAFAGVFILGFGGSRWTSDMAIGYFKAILGIGLELMTMTLLIGIATSVVDGFYAALDGSSVYELLLVFCVCCVLALLIDKIPARVAGLAGGGSGASISAGSVAAAAAVAGAAVASAGAAVAAGAASGAGGLQALHAAFSKASAAESAGGGTSSLMSAVGSAGGAANDSGSGSALAAAMGDSSGGGPGGGSGGSTADAGSASGPMSSGSGPSAGANQGGATSSSGSNQKAKGNSATARASAMASMAKQADESKAGSGDTAKPKATGANARAAAMAAVASQGESQSAASAGDGGSAGESAAATESSPADAGSTGTGSGEASASHAGTGSNDKAAGDGKGNSTSKAGAMTAKAGRIAAGTVANLAQGAWDVAKEKALDMKGAALERIGETTGGKIAAAIKARKATEEVEQAGDEAKFDGDSLSAGTTSAEDEEEIAAFRDGKSQSS